MTEQKIKLISSKGHKRAGLFEKIISDLDGYTPKKGKRIDYEYKFHIFFNFSGIEKDKAAVMAELFELRKKGLFTIFDVSNEDFLETKDVDYYLLFITGSSFITCSSERIQEKLYELTGRLAYLVANPKEELDFLPPSWSKEETPRVLWYGETLDVMTVRPYLTKNEYHIRIATPSVLSNTKDRASTAVILSDKVRGREIEKTDIVFLPPTFTKEGELRRYKKVEEAIVFGKYVIAPRLEYDWEELAFKGELDKGVAFFNANKSEVAETIDNKQEILKSKYSVENIKESVESALELATEEPIFADIVDETTGENFFLR